MLRAGVTASGPSSFLRGPAMAPKLAPLSIGLGAARHVGSSRPYLHLLQDHRSALAAGPSTPRRSASSNTATETPPTLPSPPSASSAQGSSSAGASSPLPPPPPSTASSSSSSSGGSSGKFKRALNGILWLPVVYFIMQHGVGLGQIHGESMSPTINPPNADGSPSRTSDVVLLDRFVGSTYAFRVGDIVTLRSPSDPDQFLTKRILAMEGDTVTVRLPREATHALPGASSLRSGGRGLKRSMASNLAQDDVEDENHFAVATLRLRVPPGHVWVEGDASVTEEATWEAQRALLRAASAAARSKGLASTSVPVPPSHGPAGRTRSRDSREFGPVPIGLVEARIGFVLWPFAHFGRPGPRPGFDADAMRERRERRENRVKRYIGSGQAHPGDSSISPYLDWDDGSEEEGQQEGATIRFPVMQGAGAAEDWEKVEEIWRNQLNTLSRGGSLGDHAGRDEL